MKKSSIIFRMICLAVCFTLCISTVSALAENVDEVTVEEVIENVTEEAEEAEESEAVEEEADEVEEPEAVEEETDEDADKEIGEFEDEADEDADKEIGEVEDEAEEEVLDLMAATKRDGGIYVAPGEKNNTPFTYNNVRYQVLAGTENAIRFSSFEDYDLEIYEEISENAKNILQAKGEIAARAAHSGHFGLAVSTGDVVYRVPVEEDKVYVFSAWVKVPDGGTFAAKNRDFRVVSEQGDEYIVGYNEIGRDIDETGEWQQILFTFNAPANGLFVIEFTYRGRDELYFDDVELYETVLFDEPMTIESITYTEGSGVEHTMNEGFTSSGTITHKTVFYNHDEDDIKFVGYMVLYKNNIMQKIQTYEDEALMQDTTEVVMTIDIPEDDDLSQYKYMVFFVDKYNPTTFYGSIKTNPYTVKGN